MDMPPMLRHFVSHKIDFLQLQEASGENDPSQPRGQEPALDWNTKNASCLPQDVRSFW